MKTNKALATAATFLAIMTFKSNQAQEPIKRYDRSSITYLVLNTPEKESFDIFKNAYLSVEPSQKFYINEVKNRIIDLPSTQGNIENEILTVLNKGDIGNQILATWFSVNEKGEMKPDLFLDRGLYNASDQDVVLAMATQRGLDFVKDYGENLIEKSYVVVVQLNKVFQVDKVDRIDQIKALFQQGKIKMRSQTKGYRLNVIAYLYQIDFPESKRTEFYEKCWINPDDPEEVKQQKRMAFKNLNVNFKYIDKADVTSSKFVYTFKFPLNVIITPPPFEKIMRKLVANNYDDQLNAFDKKVEDLQVKVPVFDVKPISAKVGKKEDLRINQRYFAYENTTGSGNRTNLEHIGVVRARKPSDNRHVARGDMVPSKFSQEWGARIEPGMLLVQKPDVGINVSAGYQLGKVDGLYWQFDYLLGRRAKKFPLSKLYISLQVVYDSYSVFGQKVKEEVSYVSLHRPFFLLKNVNIDPFIGFTSLTLNTGEIEGGGGARLFYGINHRFNAGLYGTYLYFKNEPYSGIPDRTGFSYGFNLQYTF